MLSYLKENKHIKDENRISELSADTVSDNLLRDNVSNSLQRIFMIIYQQIILATSAETVSDLLRESAY